MIALASGRSLPVALALIAALMWGVWWIPLYFLEALGLKGAWAGQAMNIMMLPFLLAIMLVRPSSYRLPPSAIAGGVFVGLAVTLYATGVTKTDVVRAILLFYLAPVWSLLIEAAFMGRRLRPVNGLALLSAFAGLILIFRGDLSLSGWNAGDAMALSSGLSWATGAALIFTNAGLSARAISLAAALGAIATASIILILDPGGSRFEPEPVIEALGLSIVSGAVYLAPIILITMWGALRLPPATISFLLTAEIISGVASSALLLDERFGLAEFLGAVLIASAALVEVMLPGLPSAKDREQDQAEGNQS